VLNIALRIVAAVLGGYALTAACAALLAVALPTLTPLHRGEAVILAAMLGFPLYVCTLMWGLLEPRLSRISGVTLGGACVIQVLAWLLFQPT